MSNALVQLRKLLPPSPVLLGTVVAHHPDDTSTVELPIETGVVEYEAGVVSGARLRARGTGVAVGERAFVRDGLVESRGPDGDLVEVTIGRQVTPPADMSFAGPIPNQSWALGVPVSFGTAGYFSSPFAPLTFGLIGALPAGLVFDAATGVISGARTTAAAASVAVRATDAELRPATSNTFAV